MDSIPGDQWIGEYARWLRVHESKLGGAAASAAAAKPNVSRDAPASALSSTFWNVVSLGTANINTNGSNPARPSSTTTSAASTLAARPMLLRQNPHNLYYLLIRFEALGLPIGSLDTKIPIASRPTSYFSFVAATAPNKDRDDTMSMSSMRSRISVVSSSFSSSFSWFGSSTNKPDPSRDVKYIYSCFTKIPSLRLGTIPARKLIQDFEDCPGQCAVPLDVFKNLQLLELDDVDPRTLIGWDRVCIQLRSLTCKKSGMEDITDLLVDLVIVDSKRRRGEKVDLRRLRRPAPPADSKQDLSASITTASSTDAEDTLAEPSNKAVAAHAGAREATPSLSEQLPSLAWHFLRYLNLSSNNLTFVPAEPLLCLSGLTNLDLSSNLLNVVPPSLSNLPCLTSLNISDNLIDSVLGIYDALPAIRVLNLAKNRLESLCGLERLFTLQRIDLRGNGIYESGEVGRLAPLPAIDEVWIKDNPLVEELIDYRVDCFVEFAQEGRSVTLDGDAPGFFEKQRIAERVPNAAELFAQASSGSSRLVDPSTNATPRGGKNAGQQAEENEAQLAKDVATTSRNAAVVKNVRHRAAHRSANVDSTRGRGELLDGRGGPKNGARAPGTKESTSRSRSTSRTREATRSQSAAAGGQGGGARRRNQRVVELDPSPHKVPARENRERSMTESDRIKQAALSGNSSAAMDSPEPTAVSSSSIRAKVVAEGGQDRVSAGKDKEGSTGALAAQGAMLFALPPGAASSDGKATPNSPSRRAGQQRNLSWRRNPIDSSTLGRKSAARPLASDLFATSSNATALASTGSGADSKIHVAEGQSEMEDSPAALARQRIARPRTGSAAALARRSRVTTSMYDPDLNTADPSSLSPTSRVSQPRDVAEQEKVAKLKSAFAGSNAGASTNQHADAEHAGTEHTSSEAITTTTSNRSDAFRRRIEALKSEVGDDWLRLLARGGGTAGDRNSALLLSSVNEESSEARGNDERGGPSVEVEAVAEVTRVVRTKKSKKKMRTGHGETCSSRRTSVDRTGEEASNGSARRREAHIT